MGYVKGDLNGLFKGKQIQGVLYDATRIGTLQEKPRILPNKLNGCCLFYWIHLTRISANINNDDDDDD